MNFFLFAVLNLIWNIFKSRSCSGLSGKSQVLLAMVWMSRYLDLFTHFYSVYNTVGKVLLILTSCVILMLVYHKYRSTYDHENDSFRAEFLAGSCFMLALVFNYEFSILEVLWTFSIYLEAVAMLPQLFMSLKIGQPVPMVNEYLMLLTLFRALSIANIFYRNYYEGFAQSIRIIAGFLQVVLIWSFLISFSWERKVKEAGKEQPEEHNERYSGSYIQDMTETLADIIYSSDSKAVHSLKELQNQIRRRGVQVRNDKLKEHGYKNFKMFVEDQPWLVLFSQDNDWFVRLRFSHEARLARPLVDANRHPCQEVVKEKLEEPEEVFVDPYAV